MKRSLSFPLLIGLMVVLALAFSACGAPAAQETVGEPAAEEAAPAEEAEAPAAEATEAPAEEAPPPTRPPRVRSSRSARCPVIRTRHRGRWRSHGRRHAHRRRGDQRQWRSPGAAGRVDR
ncbi:MAG: hypothetical protein R2851_09180 [Caldilineaceae bacterium]